MYVLLLSCVLTNLLNEYCVVLYCVAFLLISHVRRVPKRN